MNTFRLTLVVAVLAGVCTAQHGVDPAYLQQFYQQVAAQAGHRAAAANYADATPISEPKDDGQQQYVLPAQQFRLKDTTQEQARAQVQQHTQAYVAPSVRAQYQPQPQPQQVQYVQQPQPQPQPVHYKSAPVKPLRQQQQSVQYEAAGGKLNKESPEDYDHNPSYQFGFDVKDDEYTNYQNRKEVRDGDVIKGSYSVVDSDGFIRTVKYTADPKEGFKAEVIREPTDIVVKFPTPAPAQQQPQQQLFRHSAAPQQFVAQGAPQYRQEKPAQQPQYQYQ